MCYLISVEDCFFGPHGITLLATHATSTYYWFFGSIYLKSKISSYLIQLHGLSSHGPRDPYFKRQIHGPISFSSIGIITHDIININIWIGLKQWIKAHGLYYLSYTHGKRLFQQEPIFTQNENKTRGTSSHLRLMIQAHKSPWGNFRSRGLEGQEVCSVKLQRFKVDKRGMLLSVSSPTP